MHCQKCGKKLKPGEMFCSICGYYNSEDEMNEESDNWNDISADDEIEIEIEDDDEDSDKWFEDDETASSLDEETTKVSIKENFWEKRKREKALKKAKAEAEKAARAEQKAKEDKLKSEQKEQEDKLKAEQREQAAKEKEEKIAQQAALESERKEKLERERQEKEYQRALEKQQREKLNNKDDNYDYNELEDSDIDEKFIKAYIGEDYEKIRFKNFNPLAAILNWAYVLYRKLYITGIAGLLITEIVILKFPKLAIFYAILVILLIGFGFNKYYLFISKMVIKNQQKKFEGSDDYSMQKILSRKGGVNVIFTLIIYLIFLIILFYEKCNLSHS